MTVQALLDRGLVMVRRMRAVALASEMLRGGVKVAVQLFLRRLVTGLVALIIIRSDGRVNDHRINGIS